MTDKQLIAKVRENPKLRVIYQELSWIFDETGRLSVAQRLTLERELRRG